jgi:putative PIN family toxin of toxin-antitoxin system
VAYSRLKSANLDQSLTHQKVTPFMHGHDAGRIDIYPFRTDTHITDDMKSPPKLVIDTNILVAATRNRLGPSFALMQIIRLGQGKMCCSPALFLEYEDVLKRPNQLAACGLLGSDIDSILNELAGIIEPVTTHYQWRPQLRDPSDEMVLEAAVNAQAHAIVTYNLRDFGPSKLFGIPVLNPEQTFQEFKLSVKRSTKP